MKCLSSSFIPQEIFCCGETYLSFLLSSLCISPHGWLIDSFLTCASKDFQHQLLLLALGKLLLPKKGWQIISLKILHPHYWAPLPTTLHRQVPLFYLSASVLLMKLNFLLSNENIEQKGTNSARYFISYLHLWHPRFLLLKETI